MRKSLKTNPPMCQDSISRIIESQKCEHRIVEDLIDITPDHSKYVYYCEKCYECFTYTQYIEYTK